MKPSYTVQPRQLKSIPNWLFPLLETPQVSLKASWNWDKRFPYALFEFWTKLNDLVKQVRGVYKQHVYLLSCFSPVWLCVTICAAVHQAPLSMGFSRKEYWSGLPYPPVRYFPGWRFIIVSGSSNPINHHNPHLLSLLHWLAWVFYHYRYLGSPVYKRTCI